MDEETLAIFRAEADSLVESLEGGLLALQTRPGDRALIDQVFRDLHTLKGTGGMFGYTELAAFVHGFESAFEALRSGSSVASSELVAISLKAHDHIVALLDGQSSGDPDAILAGLAAAVGDQTPIPGPRPDVAPVAADIDIVIPPEPQPALRVQPPAAPVSVPEGPASAPAKSSSTIRISADRLDEMMDRVGELVIAEARLAEIAAKSGSPTLMSVTEDIQRLATGMRDATMSIRMTPLSSITGRFRRLVHDLADQTGKPIELVLEGEDTELDKSVVEQLAEPLMHLIRNAADHGLEDPMTRIDLDKPMAGTITLSARHSGAEVLIQLADDGQGLDAGRIRAKAVERGLISAEADLSRNELLRLVFAPGFSTAERVTELSGRGVGMDVVSRTISDLRGSVDLDSEPGQGTRITLRLPLTLAIIDGLLVEVAGERFTIPLAAVEEIVELPEILDDQQATARLLDIRGRLVPYLPLREVFGSPGRPGPFQKIVVVSSGGGRVGLVVDRIIGSNQTVIKQLSPLHSGLKIFSGATILGDGAVALILDVPSLVTRSKRPSPSVNRLQEAYV
ncbi:chemotaxis protein CheA [Rubellimicrobium arenae]|uniref:chemotaxis protein CheA n=1 Tax=Rubellimicrobium arenae TaxID=2817372 RepID=UPI001FED2D89|nr:chemotaxis protein CheA [Rubellimicrobium arenae]